MDECMRERYGLAKERIREIRTEETVKEPFGDFFRKMAQFLSMTADVMDEESVELTLEELKSEIITFIRISSRKTMKAVMEIRLMQ